MATESLEYQHNILQNFTLHARMLGWCLRKTLTLFSNVMYCVPYLLLTMATLGSVVLLHSNMCIAMFLDILIESPIGGHMEAITKHYHWRRASLGPTSPHTTWDPTFKHLCYTYLGLGHLLLAKACGPFMISLFWVENNIWMVYGCKRMRLNCVFKVQISTF